MGVWGTNILQNDVAMDIKDHYLDKRKRGVNRDQATEEMLEEFIDYIEDYDDGPYVWITLALIQWEYSELDEELKKIALDVIDHNNIVERWLEDNPTKAKKVASNLQEIKEKLKSPMTYKKKIKPYHFYHNDWEIGDVYYIELTNDLAKEYHLEGRYILIQKVDEIDSYPGHIVPVVRVRITEKKELPKTEEEFLLLENVKRTNMEYLFIVCAESKQSINKYFKYLNCYEIQISEDEENKFEPFGIIPKFFQEVIVDRYIRHNLKLYPTIEDEINNTYELVQKLVSELPEDSFMKQWKIGDVYTWKIRSVKYFPEEYKERYFLIQKVGYWVNNSGKLGILAVIKLTDKTEITDPKTIFNDSKLVQAGGYIDDIIYDVAIIFWEKEEKELKRLKYLGNYPINPDYIKYINDKKYMYYSYFAELNTSGQFKIIGWVKYENALTKRLI